MVVAWRWCSARPAAPIFGSAAPPTEPACGGSRPPRRPSRRPAGRRMDVGYASPPGPAAARGSIKYRPMAGQCRGFRPPASSTPRSRIGRPTARRSPSPPCEGAGCSKSVSSLPVEETWKCSRPGRIPPGRPTRARSYSPAALVENVSYRYLTCPPNE